MLHNADVRSAESAADIREALVRQLSQPVRWVDTIRRMLEDGATHIVECGPGKVLAGLNKRIAAEAQGLSLSDAKAFEDALVALT